MVATPTGVQDVRLSGAAIGFSTSAPFFSSEPTRFLSSQPTPSALHWARIFARIVRAAFAQGLPFSFEHFLGYAQRYAGLFSASSSSITGIKVSNSSSSSVTIHKRLSQP